MLPSVVLFWINRSKIGFPLNKRFTFRWWLKIFRKYNLANTFEIRGAPLLSKWNHDRLVTRFPLHLVTINLMGESKNNAMNFRYKTLAPRMIRIYKLSCLASTKFTHNTLRIVIPLFQRASKPVANVQRIVWDLLTDMMREIETNHPASYL